MFGIVFQKEFKPGNQYPRKAIGWIAGVKGLQGKGKTKRDAYIALSKLTKGFNDVQVIPMDSRFFGPVTRGKFGQYAPQAIAEGRDG